MDVQTENMDPPSCESQSSGKIRKGFKLFGKRKPGNIFSMRSKGDGNNKSPVNKTKNHDGLSETTAPDSEQEPDKENGQEVSQGEMEHGEEEMFGEDGVLAAAHAHASISSASSAKSLSFLSLLKGGRKGGGDRQVQTVSQPMGRKRRGLKGLFNNVKFRSKDKEDQEEAPPSPLLMLSRTSSVEIIKEDLTLTPKSKPRSLDSPKTESCELVESLTTQDSTATTPSETATPQVTAGNVSTTNKHVPPLSTSESPLVPGDNSLSSLLADISSLLTFDSISGGGDIMADVEAEWGKASSAISAVVTEVTLSSTCFSSPATSTFASTAKPSPLVVPTTALNKSYAPLTKTISSSPPTAKPSSIITTLTKSTTLTTHSVRLSSDFTPASELSTTEIKSTPTLTTGKPSATPQMTTNRSPPIMSSPLMTIKSTPSSTSAVTTTSPITSATVSKAPSVSPSLTSTVSKLASEVAAPPQMVPSEIKPSSVPTPPLALAKSLPVTHSPPIPVAFTQPPPAKLDSANNLNLQASSSLSSAGRESKAPVTVSQACNVTTKPSSPSPVPPSKITTVPSSTTTSDLVSVALSKPIFTSSPVEVNQTTPSLVTVPNLYSSSTLTGTTKTELSPASVPTPSSTFLDKTPPMTKPAPVLTSFDKMPPAPTMTPAPTTHAVDSTASPTPPALSQILVSQSKTPPPPAQIPISVSEVPPAPAHFQVSQSKALPPLAQIPISVSKEPPAPAHSQVYQTKAPSAPPQIPVSVSKEPPAPAHSQVSQTKAPSPPPQIPVSVSKEPPAPAHSQVYQTKAPSAPPQIPVSSFTDTSAPVHIPTVVSKDSPAPAQISVSQAKAPATPTSPPVPCPVPSLPSPPAPWLSEAPAAAKMTTGRQISVDEQLASPSSTDPLGAQAVPSKTDELHNESRTSLQGPSREKRTPHVKASGLSKIPVVGGGRVGKLPVRESQHVDDEARRDPPTPVLEERPHFNSNDGLNKDKISDVRVGLPTSKCAQEESQQPPQPKVLTSLPRDSKIPVKYGAQSHTASQIPQEPPRTKIPVSKVPVRRVGKPAAAGGSTQMRK